MISIIILLVFVISKIYSTPIPPNCTSAHSDYAKSGKNAQSPFWPCPEGSPKIWRQQLCDNFFNCRRSLGDEKICVDYGPSGSANITFMDDKIPVGHLGKPVVPRIYIPDFDCSAPLCVDDPNESDLIFKAHLICRQMAAATLQRLGLAENRGKNWPVALSSDVRCFGHEETIQQCVRSNENSRSILSSECTQLLAVTCAKECRKVIIIDGGTNSKNTGQSNGISRSIDPDGNEVYYAPESGMLTSPGFPNFFLPQLDCTWTLKIEAKRRLFVVTLTVLHLQEFNLGTSSGEVACINSYVELGLGMHSNGTYVKNRICSEDAVGMNFTSNGNKIYVRYVAGQYKGSITGSKGFALSYRTIEADYLDDDIPPSSPLTPGIIVLITFACVAAFVLAILGLLYCFNRSQYRARDVAKSRRADMMHRMTDNRMLPLLRAPNAKGYFSPPVVCSTCNEEIRHVDDLCPHYARLLAYVTDVDYTHLVKKPSPIRQSRPRSRRLSHNSNITIDIEELIKADRDLRKQQKRWRSMDISCISSMKTAGTAMPYESSLNTSYTVQVDSSMIANSDGMTADEAEDDKKSRTPASTRRSPQLMAKNAAKSVKNFLSTTSAKLHMNTWRTPSPNKTSTSAPTPAKTTTSHLPCPTISIARVETEPEPPPYVLSAWSLSPAATTLSVSPTKFQSA